MVRSSRGVLWFVLVPLLAVSVAVAACAPDLSSSEASKARAQAQVALDQWAAAAAKIPPESRFVPVGDLTQQVGDWESEVGDNNKRALMAGRIVTQAPLDGAEQAGEVVWTDGSKASVAVMSAQDAIVAIEDAAKAMAAPCDDCSDLYATDAALITATIDTTRGPATAPVWSFTIEGTAVKITRLATANALVVPQLPSDSSFSSIGMHMDSATGSSSGTSVTVSFIGAPEPSSKPCGEDYAAYPVESDLAVVIVVIRGAHGFALGCAAVGAVRTATATLKAPLGDRAVLNVDTGQPVPMTLLP